jgi:hypothetical protein
MGVGKMNELHVFAPEKNHLVRQQILDVAGFSVQNFIGFDYAK